MTKTSLALDMFDDGATVADVMKRTGLSAHAAMSAQVKFRQKSGCESVHHPEKSDMIDRVLRGRKDLRTYEAFGTTPDGQLGVCARSYAKYGEVVSRSRNDGDAVVVSHIAIAMALLHPHKYMFDVLDIDSYGDPGELMQIGLPRILRIKSFLFLTWPPVTDYARRPWTKKIALMQYGTAYPTMREYSDFVTRTLWQWKFRASLVESTVYEKKGITRAAFKLARVFHTNDRSDEIVTETERIFGTNYASVR